MANENNLPQRRSNIKITLAHRFQFAFAWVFLKILRVIGIDAASAIAGKTMRWVGQLLRKISRRSDDNLRRIYPDMDEAAIKRITADVWENLGRVAGEFVHFDKVKPNWDEEIHLQQLDDLQAAGGAEKARIEALKAQYKPEKENPRVKLEASQDFLKILAEQKQVVFVTGHFANWEVMSVICSQFDIPCAVLYRAANNALIDELIINIRSKNINQLQIPKGPQGARSMIDAIKQGYCVGLLVDQKYNGGLKTPLLGHDAMTATTPARMAINYDLPIIPITVRRTNGANFVMTVHDRIVIPEEGEFSERVKTVTVRINNFLSETINKDPAQWLWLHRRWGK